MNARAALTAICLLLLLHLASAQVPDRSMATVDLVRYSAESTGNPLLTLTGACRFQPGDDPRWASPTFDDAKWALLPSDRPWPIDGRYKALHGYAWYRCKVEVPAFNGPLALEVPNIRTSYQIFANGLLFGFESKAPLSEQLSRSIPTWYKLPDSGRVTHTITLAIRVWQWPGWARYYGGGPTGPLRIGPVDVVARDATLSTKARAWDNIDSILLIILEGLAGITALCVMLIRAERAEFLWFGVLMLASVGERGTNVWLENHLLDMRLADCMYNVFAAVNLVASAAFYLCFLGGRRTWFFWLALLTALAGADVVFLPVTWFSVGFINALSTFLTIPFVVWLLKLLFDSVKRKVADAQLLLIPVLLEQVVSISLQGLWTAYTLRWQTWFSYSDLPLFHWPFLFTLTDATALVYLLAVLTILLMRFARTSRVQERVEADLLAARTLQQLLIPTKIPSVPGFHVETAYRPALEVGGDFFQIVPLPGGTTLAVVGDVAGKGLPAALTVSLLVGAFQSLAEGTDSPADILIGLNRRLVGQGLQFATAIALRLGADGKVAVASAGHLPPYWNGVELQVEPSLPLGISDAFSLEETSLQVRAGDRITIMTDGVPEAACKHELFGFERTAMMSTRDANVIADEAARFGQQDDITVLSLVATG